MLGEIFGRIFFILPRWPQTVQIGITDRCNFNCTMCQRKDLGVEPKDMSLDLFNRVLERLAGPRFLILTGWGEPLLHPDLLMMIEQAVKKGLKVRLTSNGGLLTEELFGKLLNSGLEAITFSLEDVASVTDNVGHAVADQISKIERFLALKKERRNKIKVYIQSVYCQGQEEAIKRIVEWAIKHEVDRVRLTRLDIRFHNFPRPTLKDERALVKWVEARIKGTKLGFDFLPHVAFSGGAKVFYKLIRPWLHRRGRYCLRTYSDVYINADAKVTPCCALPKLEMGDILREDLKTIWQGEKFKEFRKHQTKYCGRCDVLSLRPRL